MTLWKPKAAAGTAVAEQSAQRPKRKRKWLIAAVLVLAAVLLLPKLFFGRAAKNASESAYTTAQPTQRSITRSLSGSGTLQSANSYTVVTLVEGEVLTADFEEGDIVEKDTVLYQIDSSDASTNIERQEISLSQTQRSYEKTMDTQYVKASVAGTVASLSVRVGDEVRQGETVALVRDSSVMTLKVPFPSDDAASFTVGESATVTLDSTFETLTGTVTEISGADTVGQGNMITRSVTVEVTNPGALTDTQSATVSIGGVSCAGSATFSYRAERSITASAAGTVVAINAPEGATVAKNDIILTLGGDDMEDQLQQAAESLRSAELSMETTRDQLDNYTVKSPISGTVVDKKYKAGDTVESGKQLCTIYDLSYLEMTLNIDELDISDMAVGQSVRITADAVEGREYIGVVTKVSVAGTTAGGTTSYPVTIRIDETDGLLPGMNAEAEIVVAEKSNVLAIPNGAVERGDIVLVTKDSPSAANALERTAPEGYVYVSVETGLSDDDYVEIVSGLTEGDTVAYIPSSGESSFGMMMGMGDMPAGNMGGGGGGMPSGGGGGGMPGGGF